MFKSSKNTSLVGIFASRKYHQYSHITCSTALFFVVLFLIFFTTFTGVKTAHAADSVTIELTSSPNIHFYIVPSTFDKGSVTFNASTTDSAGYSLYLKTDGLDLVNSSNTTEHIKPITLPAGNTDGILSGGFAIDTYGYSLNNTTYKPLTEAATTNGERIARTESASTDNYTLTYGVRTGIETEPGDYHLTVNIIAIANQHPFSITYNANTTDNTLANMPSVNPDEGLAELGTPIALSSSVPTRNKWTFLGWSENKNDTTPTYLAGGEITPDFQTNTSFATTLYAIWTPKTYTVVFHSNYNPEGASEEDNSAMQNASMPITTSTVLPKNLFSNPPNNFKYWNTVADGTGNSYIDQAKVLLSTTPDTTVHLYAIWEQNVYSYSFEGMCTFGGSANVPLEGNCSADDDGGYINTEIMAFSDENVNKNFDMSFTLNEMIVAASDYGGTIVNSIQETEEAGAYFPGFVIRARDGKIQIHARIGLKNKNPVVLNFEPEEVIGKRFRVFRHHTSSDRNMLYVQIGDEEPISYMDITNLVTTFNTPITIGAYINPDWGGTDRHLEGVVSDFSFEFLEDGLTYNEIAYPDGNPGYQDNLTEVFSATGPCVFHGNNGGSITGDNCVSNGPTNGKFINTGVSLFKNDSDLDVDFLIDLDLGSDYGTTTQDETQVTIIGNEYPAQTYPGFVVRRNGVNLQTIGGLKTNYKGSVLSGAATGISHISVMRRDRVLCVSYNYEPYQVVYDYATFNNFFDQPIYLGAASNNTNNDNPTSKRAIKGTLSNMSVKTGQFAEENPNCKP